MSETANFSKTPRIEMAKLTTANADLTGLGTIVPIFNAGINGSRIDKISVKSTSSVPVTNMVRFFVRRDGSAWYLFTEIPISTGTSSVFEITDEIWQSFPDGISLPNGGDLGASVHSSNAVNITVYAGDF